MDVYYIMTEVCVFEDKKKILASFYFYVPEKSISIYNTVISGGNIFEITIK